MKILIAIGVRRQREAGAAGVVFNHAEELERLGHQVECWFFDDVLPNPRWPGRFRDLEFAFAISSRIRRSPNRFDVVNLHCPWGCIYGLSLKWFPSTGLPPFVFTMQGSEDRYAWAMKFEAAKGRALNFAWKNRLWNRIYHQRMYDAAISRADFGVVANREGWILSELKYGHPPGRVWYVPNGVEKRFFLTARSEEQTANRLLYVGTWLDRKGIYYLVDAFTTLAAKAPELRLTVAGCLISEQEVREWFPPAIRNQVYVQPFVTRDAMPDLYATHDIFVFPSLMEGMPLTLLEAMASGMPLVTTNTCGMADLISDGRNGLLVPPADAAALERAIARLRSEPNLRRGLGESAQDSARNYTWELVARQLANILELANASRLRMPAQ